MFIDMINHLSLFMILRLIIMFLLFANNLVAQHNLLFNHLNVNNGLTQGVNRCVFKDSRGFVWISSFDGLNRYDGVTCTIYRNDLLNKDGLIGTMFLNIIEDLNGNLWIGSNEGLNYFDRVKGVFKGYPVTTENSVEKFCSPFYVDLKNTIWLQSGKRILKFDLESKKYEIVKNLDLNGNLLVKTVNKSMNEALSGFWVSANNDESLVFANVLPNKINWINHNIGLKTVIQSMETDGSGIWLATEKGIYKFIKDKIVQTLENSQLNNQLYNSLCFGSDNKLYAATSTNGLYIIDTTGKNNPINYTTNQTSPYTISGNKLLYVYADNENNIWVSVWGKGIDYVSLKKFSFNHHLSKQEVANSGIDNFIKSIIETENNEIWCGTQNGGVLILDSNKNVLKTIKKPLPNSIEHLYYDNEKNIWFATFAGVFYKLKNSNNIQKVKQLQTGLLANQFNFITQLKNGNMLAASNCGLYLINKNTLNYKLTIAKGISAKDVYLTCHQDNLDQIYISKPFGGFTVFSLQNDSFVLKKQFNFQSTIKSFTEFNDSIIWIASTNGLIKFNKRQLAIIQIIGTKNGLSNQYIYSALKYDHNLWISHNSGISSFNTITEKIKNYTTNDGLQSNEFNTYSFCKTSNGQLLFGGINGLNSFKPNEMNNNSIPPKLQLTQLYINDTLNNTGHNAGELKKLLLPFSKNTLAFSFTVIDYAYTTGNYFLYKLDGYDNTWIQANNKENIRYSNLPYGNYTLMVQAVNANGIKSATVYELPIKIKTPWHKSRLFRLLMLAIIICSIITLVRSYYKRKLQKRLAILEKQQAIEKERTRIATDMHDDFGANLSRIKFLSEKIKIQSSNDLLTTDLEKISSYSDEMSEKMNEIVWALNQKNDTLGDLLAFSRSYAAEYLQPYNIQLEFGNANPEIIIPGEYRRNIFLVIKESLHNVVKHSKANKVSINFTFNNQLHIIISDNGKGIDFDNVRQFSNGLENMKKRIESIAGTINIQNSNGTLIDIKIPIIEH